MIAFFPHLTAYPKSSVISDPQARYESVHKNDSPGSRSERGQLRGACSARSCWSWTLGGFAHCEGRYKGYGGVSSPPSGLDRP